MRVELTPSAISALRTARARDNDSRRAVDGSSAVPAAYPAILKLGFGPGGADGYWDALGHELFHATERRSGDATRRAVRQQGRSEREQC